MLSPVYISLKPSGGPVPVGSSHWFGYPDLPSDAEIPSVTEDGEEFALTLVCQINLADLPPGPLPADGILQFYADIAYYRGDWDEPAITMQPSDCRVCRVVYIPADRIPLLRSTCPPEAETGPVAEGQFYAEADEAPAVPLAFSTARPAGYGPELQLLGTSDHLEWETWPTPCEGWQLLLQMDSMEGPGYDYNFIDWGVLCFLIDPQALARRDFSDVRAIILST